MHLNLMMNNEVIHDFNKEIGVFDVASDFSNNITSFCGLATIMFVYQHYDAKYAHIPSPLS